MFNKNQNINKLLPTLTTTNNNNMGNSNQSFTKYKTNKKIEEEEEEDAADQYNNNNINLKDSSSDLNEPKYDNLTNKEKIFRERQRFGQVTAKISTLVSGSKKKEEEYSLYTITPRGAIISGSNCNPHVHIKEALANYGYTEPPLEINLSDSRAHRVLIIHTDRWYVAPSQEYFSRHSGTCIVLGDKKSTSQPFEIKIGDCFRLGSVGLVVAEVKTVNGEEQHLDSKQLDVLIDEAFALDSNEDFATLAAEEGISEKKIRTIYSDNDKKGEESDIPINGGGVGMGEIYICYMCYETHDTEDDPLIAPCHCRGDTRYLHRQCLHKWYFLNVSGPQAQVIRITGSGAPACKICGAAYKSVFKKADGKTASLLESDSTGPFLSLVVVTKHETNPGLFNTKFRLNFGSINNVGTTAEVITSLLIGRSSSCNLVLDYKTVSTIHAKIIYDDGIFYLQDQQSSNGTMVFLRNPIPLSFSYPIKLRTGRTTISLIAKRSWTSSLREIFTKRQSNDSSIENDIGIVSEESDNMILPSSRQLQKLMNITPQIQSSSQSYLLAMSMTGTVIPNPTPANKNNDVSKIL